MRVLLSLFLVLAFMGGTTQLCLAAADSFNVKLRYGSDTQSPTTPVPLTVTPVASTQIDVAWGTSTDNLSVAGYQLFRDAAQIATTTLTSYSDTGLIASTTYSYNVIAFDTFGNFSTSSITVATTTFSPTPPPPVAATTTPGYNGQQATITRLRLTSFDIIPSTKGAKFEFSTNLPTRYLLRYGKSSIYDDGIVESPIYKSSHVTSLFPLEAGTTYVYELLGFDRWGREVLLSDGNFSTSGLPDTTAPANVANFSATPMGSDVFLRWDNPNDDDFVYVRIVRNYLFYPNNDSDGFLVYEGASNSVTDQNGLGEYDLQYYTVFTYDSSGNVSSGAVSYATIEGSVGSTPTQGEVSTGTSPGGSVEEDIDGQTTADMTVLYASSVQILQDGVRQSLSDQFVILDARLPYEIFIPIQAVPGNLKTIMATVVNPSNQRSATTYLLKINYDKTGYSALLSAPNVVGSSRITIELIDYTLGTVLRMAQSITFSELSMPTPLLLGTISKQDVFPWIIRGSVILFLFFLLYVIFAVRLQHKNGAYNIAVEVI
jgi:hypothetical protein